MSDVVAKPAKLEIDLTYGGVYAGTSLEFSVEVADHFNSAAARANDVLEGEFTPFVAGEYFSVACPIAAPWPREEFIAGYNELDLVVDGETKLHLGDYPRLFSNSPTDVSQIRAVPTYIPKGTMPDSFFANSHMIELLQDGRSIFGPTERFFHSHTSGAIFSHLEDGYGRLVVEIGGDLSGLTQHGQVIFFTDPAFGEPTGATQLNDDGSSASLPYRLLGKDHVGDVFLFNEGIVPGVKPRGERVVVELHLPNRGTGLGAALYAGHTRDLAFRADTEVL